MKFRLLIFIALMSMLYHPNVLAEEISSFNTIVNIQSSGVLHVDEQINYDFENISRHGIYRNIPFTKTNTQGKKYEMNISNISVVDPLDIPYTHSVATEGEEKKIKIGDNDKTISGKHEYHINYDVAGALTYFSDHDELYWNITGNGWDYPIQKATARISLPSSVPEKDIKVACYTGAAQSKDMACLHEYAGGVVKVTSQTSLQAGEGLTVVVGFPKGIVAVLEPTLFKSFWRHQAES